jgi:hypothetical protein
MASVATPKTTPTPNASPQLRPTINEMTTPATARMAAIAFEPFKRRYGAPEASGTPRKVSNIAASEPSSSFAPYPAAMARVSWPADVRDTSQVSNSFLSLFRVHSVAHEHRH